MSPDRWQQIKDLFHSALERDSTQRSAYMAEVCAGDPDLRSEVESLLAYDEREASFLSAPLGEIRTTSADDAMVGRQVGPYRLVREIGHGGMGAVYLASRVDGRFQKQVAVKVLKRGMDTDVILRRFRQEQQVLATFDHPNIVKLIDAGISDDGRPYFIMEYVEGVPIDVYCDTHRLPTAERLTLFRTVCDAVAYAHDHQVIHRDLKPSNMLITREGVPKLLDFGIAKLLTPELSGRTLDSTATAPRPMTPEYASPEQVRGGLMTPASDVYALGALLYELLTGHRPYRGLDRTPQEIVRAICEAPAEKPSTAINRIEQVPGADGELTLTPASVSSTRDGEPETLRRRLAGDLDAIVLMALRKEPERRYASVETFSEDLRRHQEGLPITARRDTRWYRGGKFVKRHRAAFVTTVTGLMIALAGIGGWVITTHGHIESIAVLPFVNISADANTEYLSDGITETLMNDLSRVPSLKILPRSAVFRYKGREQDPQAVGQTLRVQAVVTGRVFQREDSLSIRAELVDVRSNRRLWGETYTRKASDLLALQEEIARSISDQLRLRLSGEEPRLTKRYTENAEAYRAFLKGRYYRNKTTPEGATNAIAYFEQAINLDPRYALAYAWLGDSFEMSRPASVHHRRLMPKRRPPHSRRSSLMTRWPRHTRRWDSCTSTTTGTGRRLSETSGAPSGSSPMMRGCTKRTRWL